MKIEYILPTDVTFLIISSVHAVNHDLIQHIETRILEFAQFLQNRDLRGVVGGDEQQQQALITNLFTFDNVLEYVSENILINLNPPDLTTSSQDVGSDCSSSCGGVSPQGHDGGDESDNDNIVDVDASTTYSTRPPTEGNYHNNNINNNNNNNNQYHHQHRDFEPKRGGGGGGDDDDGDDDDDFFMAIQKTFDQTTPPQQKHQHRNPDGEDEHEGDDNGEQDGFVSNWQTPNPSQQVPDNNTGYNDNNNNINNNKPTSYGMMNENNKIIIGNSTPTFSAISSAASTHSQATTTATATNSLFNYLPPGVGNGLGGDEERIQEWVHWYEELNRRVDRYFAQHMIPEFAVGGGDDDEEEGGYSRQSYHNNNNNNTNNNNNNHNNNNNTKSNVYQQAQDDAGGISASDDDDDNSFFGNLIVSHRHNNNNNR